MKKILVIINSTVPQEPGTKTLTLLKIKLKRNVVCWIWDLDAGLTLCKNTSCKTTFYPSRGLARLSRFEQTWIFQYMLNFDQPMHVQDKKQY